VKISLLALPFALLLGCASLPHPTDEDVRRARTSWPEASLDSLEQGRTSFANTCSGCHALPLIHVHTAAEWPKVVKEMAERAELDQDQARLIEEFLVTFSQRPLPK
jgi:hypothetical protein